MDNTKCIPFWAFINTIRKTLKTIKMSVLPFRAVRMKFDILEFIFYNKPLLRPS